MSGDSAACASSNRNANGTRMPVRVSGTTTSVTTGIATALASGAMSDVCPKSASVSGVSPTVTTHCARADSAAAHDRRSPGLHHLAFTAPTREAVDALYQELLPCASS